MLFINKSLKRDLSFEYKGKFKFFYKRTRKRYEYDKWEELRVIIKSFRNIFDKIFIGYPSMESVIVFFILEYFFTEEAKIAIKLKFFPESSQKIYRRLIKERSSMENFECNLDNIHLKVVFFY